MAKFVDIGRDPSSFPPVVNEQERGNQAYKRVAHTTLTTAVIEPFEPCVDGTVPFCRISVGVPITCGMHVTVKLCWKGEILLLEPWNKSLWQHSTMMGRAPQPSNESLGLASRAARPNFPQPSTNSGVTSLRTTVLYLRPRSKGPDLSQPCHKRPPIPFWYRIHGLKKGTDYDGRLGIIRWPATQTEQAPSLSLSASGTGKSRISIG
jgi:hypothetical protein